MRRETGTPKIFSGNLIIPELYVLVLTKRHVGSGNEIGQVQATMCHPGVCTYRNMLQQVAKCTQHEPNNVRIL